MKEFEGQTAEPPSAAQPPGESQIVAIDTAAYHDTVAGLTAEAAGQIEEKTNGAVAQATVDHTIEFAASVVESLSESPRWLDCRYLYDAQGSHIFERICEQPEYYLTRTEGSILAAAGLDIALQTKKVTLIELGSGSSIKTRLLLEAYCDLYGSARYTPVDISRAVLEHAEEEINGRHPDIDVDPLHGTYDEAFPLFSKRSPAMLLFLGSTLGNLDEQESYDFWQDTAASLQPGDFCLLGIDINEDIASINAAYNDKAGFSEAFTRNLFERMNRELGSSIDTDSIDHVATFNENRGRVEIFARFRREQIIEVAPFSRSFEIEAGEMIMTEISCKFRLDYLIPYLTGFGFAAQQIYADSDNKFAVLLLRRK